MTEEERRKKQIEEASGATYTGTPTPIAPSPEPFDTGDASPDWWMNTAATKQTANSPTTAEPSTAVQEQMGDVMTTAGMMVPGMTAAPPPPTGDIVGTGTGWPPPNDGIFLQGDPNANGGYIPLQPGQPPALNLSWSPTWNPVSKEGTMDYRGPLVTPTDGAPGAPSIMPPQTLAAGSMPGGASAPQQRLLQPGEQPEPGMVLATIGGQRYQVPISGQQMSRGYQTGLTPEAQAADPLTRGQMPWGGFDFNPFVSANWDPSINQTGPNQPPAPLPMEDPASYQARVKAWEEWRGIVPYQGGTAKLPDGAQREMPIRNPGESGAAYQQRLSQYYQSRGQTQEAQAAQQKAQDLASVAQSTEGFNPAGDWNSLWGGRWEDVYREYVDRDPSYMNQNRINTILNQNGGLVKQYEDRVLMASRDAQAGLSPLQMNHLQRLAHQGGFGPGSPQWHSTVLHMAGVQMPGLDSFLRQAFDTGQIPSTGSITWADGTTVDAPSGGNTVLPPWMSDGAGPGGPGDGSPNGPSRAEPPFTYRPPNPGDRDDTGIPGAGGGGGGTGGGTGGGGTRSPNPYRNEWMTSDNLANWSRNWMDNPSRYDADVVRQGMEVIEQALGRVRDEGMAGMDEYMAGRGLVGSSVEAGERGLLEDRVQRAASERAFALLQDQARTFGDDRSRAFGANLASADFLSGLHRNRERLDQQDFANRMAQSGLDLGTIDTILRGIATVDPEVLSGYLTPEQIRALLGGGR